MDELVNKVAQKTGIPPDSAKKAVETVRGFLKEKLPAGRGGQLDSVLGDGSSGGAEASGGLGDVVKKLGGLLGG